MLRSALRSRVAVTAGGLVTAGAVDRLLTPPVAPLSTAAAASAIGGVRIYQYEICPFCNKVKAMLDLYKVPYETLDVNPLTKKEIKFSPDYRKVPITVVTAADGAETQLNDSPHIAASLLQRMHAAKVVSNAEFEEFRSPAALEWAKWSDQKLAVLLFPRMTRSFSESFQAFGYVMQVPHFSMVEKLSNQLVGSFAMWMAQGKIKKKYGIEDESAAVREAIGHWVSEGVGSAAFAGGEKPNFADVCVYGAIKAIERTPAFAEVMAETEVAPWYDRMQSAVQPGSSCVLRQ